MPGDSKTGTLYIYSVELSSAITTLRDVFHSLKNQRNEQQQSFFVGDTTLVEKVVIDFYTNICASPLAT